MKSVEDLVEDIARARRQMSRSNPKIDKLIEEARKNAKLAGYTLKMTQLRGPCGQPYNCDARRSIHLDPIDILCDICQYNPHRDRP